MPRAFIKRQGDMNVNTLSGLIVELNLFFIISRVFVFRVKICCHKIRNI